MEKNNTIFFRDDREDKFRDKLEMRFLIAGSPRDFPSASLLTPLPFLLDLARRQSWHATNARKEPHTKAHPRRL